MLFSGQWTLCTLSTGLGKNGAVAILYNAFGYVTGTCTAGYKILYYVQCTNFVPCTKVNIKEKRNSKLMMQWQIFSAVYKIQFQWIKQWKVNFHKLNPDLEKYFKNEIYKRVHWPKKILCWFVSLPYRSVQKFYAGYKMFKPG